MAKITGIAPKAPELSKKQLQQLNQLGSTVKKSPDGTFGTLSVEGISSGPKFPAPNAILGTPGDDELKGNSKSNTIFALTGNDKVYGNKGNDTINGGGGEDTLRGNSGNDIIFGDNGESGNPDQVNGANDILYGHSGDDFLYGQGKDDNIYAGIGNDVIEGGNGNDTIFGASGNDFIFGEDRFLDPGLGGNDKLQGGDGNDVVAGGFGNDFVKGDSGNDILFGGKGFDTLIGNQGNDELMGADAVFFGLNNLGFGKGEIDRLNGNKGKDTFYLGIDNAKGRRDDGSNGNIGDVVLYNDGNAKSNGDDDYGLIEDFSSGDKVFLVGSDDDYSLGSSPVKGVSGTGIFLEEGQKEAELIGILKGVSSDSVSLDNSKQFTFG